MESTEHLARNIRILSVKMVHRAKASHIGSALSIADILAVLYGQVLNFDARDEHCVDRDRFILSKGHACAALYAALHLSGFLSEKDLESYGQEFSPLMNHASHKAKGVEFSTGALGHGLPFGVGKALAAKIEGKPWHTYVLLSDGEMDEGSNWEAFMFAAHHKLSNLTAIIDYNKLQSIGSVEETLGLEPLVDKLKAFGAAVIEIDGHNHNEIYLACKERTETPKVVLAHTTKGKGVSYMENQVLWHYRNPSDELLVEALKDLEI